MDLNLVRVASALSSSKDDESVNSRNLVRNMRDCCKEIELAISNQCLAANCNNNTIKDRISKVQEGVLVAVLLSCPCVQLQSEVISHPQLQSMISSLPCMSDETFALVVRAVSYHNVVYPLLAILPTNVTLAIMNTCLRGNIKNPQPTMLSFIIQMTKGFLYALQFESSDHNVKDMTSLVLPALTGYVDSFDKVSENSAYTLLHLLDLLLHMSSIIAGCLIKNPSSSRSFDLLTAAFTKNVNTTKDPHKISEVVSESLLGAAATVLDMCQTIVCKIDVNSWIAWSEIEPNESFYCLVMPRENNEKELTMQLLISYLASFVLKLFKDNTEKDLETSNVSSTSNSTRKAYFTNLSNKYEELYGFLKQIKIDPNHDPTDDVSFEEMISLLQNTEAVAAAHRMQDTLKTDGSDSNDADAAAISKTKKVKLFKRLVEWPERAKLFQSAEAAQIVANNIEELTESQTKALLSSYLNLSQPSEELPWKMLLLGSSKELGSCAIMAVLQAKFAESSVCCDWLLTDQYPANLTAACNTLVAQNADTESSSSGSTAECGALWWLCLQCPQQTIERLVHVAVTVSGMATSTAMVVHQLAAVAQARTEWSELSLLNSALEEYLASPGKLEKPKHEAAYLEFFSVLCQQQGIASRAMKQQAGAGSLSLEEVLQLLVLPRLQWATGDGLRSTALPYSMMQMMLHHVTDDAFGCISAGEMMASLLLALLNALHNCYAFLESAATDAPGAVAASASDAKSPGDQGDVPADEDVQESLQDLSFEEENLTNPDSMLSSHAPAKSPSLSDVNLCVTFIRSLRNTLQAVVQCILLAPNHCDSIETVWLFLRGDGNNVMSHMCLKQITPLFEMLEAQGIMTAQDVAETTKESTQGRALTQHKRTISEATKNKQDVWRSIKPTDWMLPYLQELRSGLMEDWISACEDLRALHKLNKAASVTDEKPAPVLCWLSGILRLLVAAPQVAAGGNLNFCYRNFNAAAGHFLMEESKNAGPAGALQLLCSVFCWWCRHYVPLPTSSTGSSCAGSTSHHSRTGDNSSGLICVLLVRVLDSIRELGEAEHLLTDTKTGTLVKDNKQKKRLVKEKVKKLTRKEFKRSIKNLVEPFVKYMPASSLSITVATTLVSLVE